MRMPRNFSQKTYSIVVVVIALGLLWLVVYPLGVMVWRVFVLSGSWLDAFRKVIHNPAIGTTLLDTVIIAIVGSVAATLIASVFAWLVERTDARIGWVTSILPLIPLLLPPIAMSIGWLFIADPTVGYLNVAVRALLRLVGIDLVKGPFNIGTWPGVLFAYIVYLVPFCYLVTSSGLRALDPALEEASRTSGAGVWRTLREVSLPAMKPAIAGAILVSAMFSVAVYSIPGTLGALAGVRPVAVEIVELMQSYPSEIGQAVVLSVFVFVLLGALWLIERRVSLQGHHAVLGSKAARASLIELGAWKPVAQMFLLGYIVIAAVLPALGLFVVAVQPFWSQEIKLDLLSFENFRTLFEPGSATRMALINSLTLGFASATVTMILAVMLVAHARESRGMLGKLTEAASKLPAVVPHVVVGVAFILAFAGAPFALHGTRFLLLLAYVTMFIPQASISVGTSYDQIGGELLEASRVSGAGRGTTLREIAIPLMRPGLAAGWMLVFVVGTGELNASILLSSAQNPVVGYQFFQIWDGGTFPELAALALVLAGVTCLVVTLVTIGLSGDPAQKRSTRPQRKSAGRLHQAGL